MNYFRNQNKKRDRVHSPHHKKQSYFKRLAFIFFLLITLLFVSSVMGQKVTLNTEKESIVKILEDIKGQTQYSFFYNKSIGLDDIKATIKVSNQPLTTALDELFKDLPYTYTIANNTIVITTKIVVQKIPLRKIESIEAIQTDLWKNIIKGKIVDENNHPLESVLIQDANLGTYTYSKANGEFELNGDVRGVLSISGYGYVDKELQYTNSDYLLIRMNTLSSTVLKDVEVSSIAKKDPTHYVDLTNRAYMNLGQVLEGTVPGLTLQILSSSKTNVTSIDVFIQYRNGSQVVQNFVNMTVDEFLSYEGAAKGQQIIDALLQNPNAYPMGGGSVYYYKLHTSSVTTNIVVPQVRGENSFTGNSTNMLIVIDGFPQDNFQSDYPMANVESVEVIKDPKELIKWGARAAGGIILIKTKSARKGALKVNYSTNVYYTPAPKYDPHKQQLASVSDYLDYQKDFGFSSTPTSLNLRPSQILLGEKYYHNITNDQFNASWDSLKSCDNTSQLRLLQQNAVSQNHTLSVSGGSQLYRFNFIGSYYNNQGNDLNSYNKSGSFSLNNHFNLFKDKLQIDWLINVGLGKTRTATTTLDPNNTIEPYQLLLDKNGNYVYDYSTFSPSVNSLIESYGYKNYGVNILQDDRINKTTSKYYQGQTRFNFSWSLLPDLKWITAVYYTGKNTTSDKLYDKESSYTRQLVDNYGMMQGGSINFYVPYGDILNRNKSRSEEWNVRSGLSYSKTFGKNQFSVSVGGGAASVTYRQPASSTMFGYNSKNNSGVPIFLPTPDPTSSITNFYTLLSSSYSSYTSSVTPYSLTIPVGGDSTMSRNVNFNGSLAYKFGDRISISGTYNSVFNPLYGQNKTYSTLSNYDLDATGLVFKNANKQKLFNKVLLSTGLNGVIMPTLPVSYNNSRYIQTDWNNYTIWVTGLSPTQQEGQKTYTFYQKLTFDFFDSRYKLNVTYNTQKIKGSPSSFSTTQTTSSDTSYTLHYLSAGMQVNLRKGLLNVNANYSKSPEGQSQVNGTAGYDIARESYFHYKKISTLKVGAEIESVSPYQALGLMMGTNVASGGSYSSATNSSFGVLPPKNTNWEGHFIIGLKEDAYLLDLRYYNHETSGLNNYVPAYTDPSTGLTSQTTYSSITNKGVEFFLKTRVIKSRSFNYSITLNGAYNVNIAKSVPVTAFSATSSYSTAYRNGYNTSNIWSFKWAGLDTSGNPRVYNAKGNLISASDSVSLASAMVYSGVTNAPWAGGLIHEFSYKRFFARVAFTFKWGYVMKRYIPPMNTFEERSILIKDRWKQAGDEKNTDIAAIALNTGNTLRAFVIQNSSNSILSADNIRLQEVMLGYNLPVATVNKLGLSFLTVTLQAQNLAVWTKNSLHIDPSTVGNDGKVGLPVPRQYSFTVNVGL